jgi:hypothetical protein
MFLARGGREDHRNSIAAGAAAFGLAKARRGALAATLFALLGAATFAGLAGALGGPLNCGTAASIGWTAKSG